jgi:hypothetical protein
MVTAAAVLLFIIGGLQCLAGLIAVFGGTALVGSFGSGLLIFIGLVLIAIGVLHIYAGVKVLDLQEQGRIIGIVIAGIGAFLSLLRVVGRPGSGIVSLIADLFILYALITNARYFRP